MPQVFFSLVIVLIALKKTEIQFFGIMLKYLSLRNFSINTKTFSTEEVARRYYHRSARNGSFGSTRSSWVEVDEYRKLPYLEKRMGNIRAIDFRRMQATFLQDTHLI